jgi:hypothetical protein
MRKPRPCDTFHNHHMRKLLSYLRRAFESLRESVGGIRRSQDFQDAKLFAFMVFHWSMVLLAIVLIATAIYPPAHAQNRDHDQYEELSRRIGAFESMDLAGQLAQIHQQLADMLEDSRRREADWKPMGTALAAAALVLERAARAMAGRVKAGDIQ